MRFGSFDVIDLRDLTENWGPPDAAPQVGIAVHHTVSDRDIDATNDVPGIQSIQRFHRGTRGWPGTGYNLIIGDDGKIYYVGDISVARAHVWGMNDVLDGIALLGDYTAVLPPPPQIEGCGRGIVALRRERHLPGLPFKGHRDWAKPGYGTACPGDRWPSYEDDLELAVAAIEGGPHPMLEMSRSSAVGLARSQLKALRQEHKRAEDLVAATWGYAFYLHGWVLPPELQ